MANIEKEFKWVASSRGAFGRFLRAIENIAGPLPMPENLRITDRYLDNADGDFFSRKIALRIRYQKGSFEATLKTRTAIKNGLAVRKELTRPLPLVRSFSAALKALEQGETWEGVSLLGLSERFCLRNRRQIYVVYFGAAVCEVALDKYVIMAGEKRLAQREIELELKSGSENDFVKFVEKLNMLSGLSAAKISKVASAEKLLNS